MEKALAQARLAYDLEEVPIGCVIVKDNQIIASAHNTKVATNNSLNHAEMIALTKAQQVLNTKYLYDCTMYLTLEPCAMCSGAMLLCRLKKLVYGAREPKFGCAGSLYNLLGDNRNTHHIEVEEGVMADECSAIMTSFFEQRRKKC
jgi:tRNA(adenine34) deaminase